MGVVYLAYTTGVAVASGETIPMTVIVRRDRSNVGTSMNLKGKGYYVVDVDATLASTAGGNATITLLQDNDPVVGASATETIDAAGTAHLHLTAVVRNTCCDPISSLAVQYTGVALNSTLASVVIRDA